MGKRAKGPEEKNLIKILITGATGFVGSVLIPQLTNKYDVKNISVFILPEEKIPDSWGDKNLTTIRGNIIDKESVINACRDHTHVIHLAGLISYRKRDKSRLENVNVQGVANIVDACLKHRIQKLIHISSVGAIGFYKKGQYASEDTPFNWPTGFVYMDTKHRGQLIVENAARTKNLPATILNPASIMGPGDPDINTPHNQLYKSIYNNHFFGSFSGGLAIVDVRDLTSIILKSIQKEARGEKYLIVGANTTYQKIIKTIGKYAGKKVYPLRLPSFLVTTGGLILESVSLLTGKKPLLTKAYGKLSGWNTYYSNEKSKKEFSHKYFNIEKTIHDSCIYFEKTFL